MNQIQIIDEIISADQYNLSQEEKEKKLLPILKQQLKRNIDYSENFKSFLKKFHVDIDSLKKINEIPPLPVNIFKFFDLKTCKDKDVIRVLHSSSTTTGIPSKIYLDKMTAFRQTKAFISTLKNYIGKTRRPLLIIDSEDVNKANLSTITARGAAIRAVTNFGSKRSYVMDYQNGELVLNEKKLDRFCETYKNQEILVYGFTYIIWSRFVNKMLEKNIQLNFPKMKLLHSGGWKKLEEKKVNKKIFNSTLARIFNTKPENIIDFYGMVEQVGVIFPDCEKGYKHIPDFADIIIRDVYTMEENMQHQPGFIEVMSILPTSYPGQALLTEDIGELMGIDDCPCQRKGKYFVFRSRAKKVELRGCGDTFAERSGE